jgi:DNA helicase-2/ATP-dependent DNA helicase PcrA
MDVSPILNPLNEAQRAAVTAPLGPVLVLAGAGSGKTRVLTHRIAWVIQAEGASPHGILAVTFTNKAAGEMRARVEQLLGVPGGGLWIGTFHGIAHRLLRLHWREANLVQGFQILDAEDQQRLIRKLLKASDLDETRWVPREVQWFSCTRRTSSPAAVPGWWISRSCCCAHSNCGATTPGCWRTTGGASSTCWSMSSRTPMPSSTPG